MKTFYKYSENIWPDFGENSYGIKAADYIESEMPQDGRRVIRLWNEEMYGENYHEMYIMGMTRGEDELYDSRDFLYKIDDAVGDEKEIVLALGDDRFSGQLLEYFMKMKESKRFRLHVLKEVNIPVREEKERFLLKYTEAIEEMDSVAFFNRASIISVQETDWSNLDELLENKRVCHELLREEIKKAVSCLEELSPVGQKELWLYNTQNHAYEKIEICEEDIEKLEVGITSVYENIASPQGREMCRKLKKYRLDFKEKHGVKTKEYSCVYQGPCKGSCNQCEAYAEELYRKVYGGIKKQDKKVYAQINGVERLREETDGPGIRTLVVMNDCHLGCKYCLNKDYINIFPMNSAMSQYELTELVKKDMVYFEMSGGGVTFGGGEPLLSPEYIRAFKEANSHLHVAVETSLNVPYENFEQAADYADLWIVDIKDMNEENYRAYTGRSNENVIYNLTDLLKRVPADKIVCRVPLIEGFNSRTDVEKSVARLKEMGVVNLCEFTYIPGNPQ